MINLVSNAQSWGILILASEIVWIFLGVGLLSFQPRYQSLKVYLLWGVAPFFFGIIGSAFFHAFNNQHANSPFHLGILTIFPQLLICAMGILIAEREGDRN